mmetsp:Transcript_3058/g.3542  ORF Transcript_3058/g.3542 Transcript_3058/m.3542 type:complete len:290 (+) Transcript_3058:156-1025(+)
MNYLRCYDGKDSIHHDESPQQRYHPTATMSSISQSISGMNYFRCHGKNSIHHDGSPQQYPTARLKTASHEYPEKQQGQEQHDCWNYPLVITTSSSKLVEDAPNSPSMWTRSTCSDSISMLDDNRRRIIGPKVSFRLEGKTLKDREREDQARARAMKLSESLMVAAKKPGYRKTTHKFIVDTKTDQKLQAIRAAIELKQKQRSVEKTETTRHKKQLLVTPKKVKDPETVQGMKCSMDIEREEKSKKKALDMISHGFYPYAKNAGTPAIYSSHGTKRKTRRTGHYMVNEIV